MGVRSGVFRSDGSFPPFLNVARMRPLLVHPPCRPLAAGLPVRTPCAYSASLPPVALAHPVPLAPARHARPSHAASSRPSHSPPARHRTSLTRWPSLAVAFPSGHRAPTPPRYLHPLSLAPTRRACPSCAAGSRPSRAPPPPGRAKPSAASDGGAGGARVLSAPTPMTGIVWPRPLPCCNSMF
jgi:hypothetical protein